MQGPQHQRCPDLSILCPRCLREAMIRPPRPPRPLVPCGLISAPGGGESEKRAGEGGAEGGAPPGYGRAAECPPIRRFVSRDRARFDG